MKKLIATISVITALGAGAFALNAVLPAGATNTSVTQTGSGGPAAPSSNCDGPRAKFKNVLDGLVQNGTITQDQEDKIVQAFKDAAADNQRVRGRHPRARQALRGMVETAANTIGVSPADLVTELKTGKSVADVANEHNVAPDTVVKAIVDAGTAKVDEAVTNGKITQAQGDKIKSRLSDAASKFVNTTRGQC